ncbi:hypothetical protein APSETT445_001168 [Aspergillus pseudonomiae]
MSGLSPQQIQYKAPQSLPRPPFDPAFKNAGGLARFTDELNLQAARRYSSTDSADAILEKFPHLAHVEYNVPAVKGLDDHSSTLSIFRSKCPTDTKKSVLYYIHGGGQVSGTRFSGLDSVISLLPENENLVFATIEYRLAPEYRAPAGAYDCYAGLVYLADNAVELGVNPANIVVFGISGGGPLAAASCLLSRNLGYPQVRAQMLVVPMLDDRDEIGVSWRQFETGTLWPGQSNRMAWDMVLGQERGGPHVDEVRCAARAIDLSKLPPAFIDVGECEVFRDGAVAYASRIWESGGTAELHVWPGVYHGAHLLEDTPVTQAMLAAQRGYIVRALELCED